MTQQTGCVLWGFDPRIMYILAAYHGAAFMQLTGVNSYLRPLDIEKPVIIERLKTEGLHGENGMALVVAGGLGAHNIGRNIETLGAEGRMFLAGTSVYSHPNGAHAGVRAAILAYRAYQEERIIRRPELVEYGRSLGLEGAPLVEASRESV